LFGGSVGLLILSTIYLIYEGKIKNEEHPEPDAAPVEAPAKEPEAPVEAPAKEADAPVEAPAKEADAPVEELVKEEDAIPSEIP
jgi:hypothetical protein